MQGVERLAEVDEKKVSLVPELSESRATSFFVGLLFRESGDGFIDRAEVSTIGRDMWLNL